MLFPHGFKGDIVKRDTKKKLFAGFIIFTFALSSLAFIATFLTGGGLPQQQEFRPLQSFIVEGPINPQTESRYVQAGFTSMRFYYNSGELLSFVEQLPQTTKTNTGQQQLIVQKIPDNETRVLLIALNGEEEITDVTRDNIVGALCRVLTVTPLECAFNATR